MICTLFVLLSNSRVASHAHKLLKNYDFVKAISIDMENHRIYVDVDDKCPCPLELVFHMDDTLIDNGHTVLTAQQNNPHLKWYKGKDMPEIKSNYVP